jgi:hypothetical protein
MDRRIIRQRIAQIKRDLEEVRAHRARHRSQRRKNGLPTVALVGYTNAGKSTLLMRSVAPRLTSQMSSSLPLDPTTRRVELPGGTVIWSRTPLVSFRNYPHNSSPPSVRHSKKSKMPTCCYTSLKRATGKRANRLAPSSILCRN